MEKGFTINVLDHGHVSYIDSIGDDNSICDAARTSTNSKKNNNAGLIDYLIRHRHTSPFEFVEIIFKIKCPIFCMRQIIRHRTANVNETSLRYTEAQDDFFIPDEKTIRKQSLKNKQMTDELLDDENREYFCNDVEELSKYSYDLYNKAITNGVCREQARILLPINLYTEFYWKMDLHNLFNFLKLRLDSHAQKETMLYADAIYNICKNIVPITCKSFEDHILNSMSFSKTEIDVLYSLLKDYNFNIDEYKNRLAASGIEGGRLLECIEKIKL